MMAITLKRQLNEDEKARIVEIYGHRCFATGHVIPEGEPLHFDHIKAWTSGGLSELDNIAPMCEEHNLAKGTLPLEDFRVKLRLEDFFTGEDALTLKDLLAYMQRCGDIGAYGRPVAVTELDSKVHIESSSDSFDLTLYACPTTGWKYFYATLPLELLDSDDESDHEASLQPRYLICDKVFELYRHFQRHPVLQPSVGRIRNNRIVLFDGQHKMAALLWVGRRVFECKIYLSPELRLLNQTNIAAHDRFAQTRFYTSVMVVKLGAEFGADFESYKRLEDGQAKSEAGFVRFLERDPDQTMSKADIKRRFRSYLYSSVLESPDNRAARYVSNANRSTDQKPLTMDMLTKSLFACFMYTEPIEDDMATDAYQRDKEIANNIALMNMLYDLGLAAWNPQAGANDSTQRKLNRLLRSKSIMAWAELLRDAICGKLELQDAEDRQRPFYRDLPNSDLVRVKKVTERLVNWNRWSAPADDEIDRVLSDNKSAVKNWLKSHGLTTGYLSGAPE
jgi:hypothetical protein